MEGIHSTEKSKATPQFKQATMNDCELMFRLQKLDGAKLDPQDLVQAEKFAEYEKDFLPAEIQVIHFDHKAVGRLRVVRGKEIYLGGIQVLPEYRGKGIGTAILESLIEESEQAQRPIRLEVFHDNVRAFSLYKKLGFKVIQENERYKTMEFKPEL